MTDSRRMVPYVKEGHWPPHGQTGYITVDNKRIQKRSGYIHPEKMNRAARRQAWRQLTSRSGRMYVRYLKNLGKTEESK